MTLPDTSEVCSMMTIIFSVHDREGELEYVHTYLVLQVCTEYVRSCIFGDFRVFTFHNVDVDYLIE